jgi:hypothetical protein
MYPSSDMIIIKKSIWKYQIAFEADLKKIILKVFWSFYYTFKM